MWLAELPESGIRVGQTELSPILVQEPPRPRAPGPRDTPADAEPRSAPRNVPSLKGVSEHRARRTSELTERKPD